MEAPDRLHSGASLGAGAQQLREQPQPTTPIRKAKSEVTNDLSDPMSSFSPETAALLRCLPDTPKSLSLKAYYLQAANQLQRGYSTGSAGGTIYPPAEEMGGTVSEVPPAGAAPEVPPAAPMQTTACHAHSLAPELHHAPGGSQQLLAMQPDSATQPGFGMATQPSMAAHPGSAGVAASRDVEMACEPGLGMAPDVAWSLPVFPPAESLPSAEPCPDVPATQVPPGPPPVEDCKRHLDFDQAAFERDMLQQLRLDEAEETYQTALQDRKRKLEEEEWAMQVQLQERMEERNRQHVAMMEKMEAEYNEQCRRHKESLRAMQEEHASAQKHAQLLEEQARAAEESLAQSQRALVKARVQEKMAELVAKKEAPPTPGLVRASSVESITTATTPASPWTLPSPVPPAPPQQPTGPLQNSAQLQAGPQQASAPPHPRQQHTGPLQHTAQTGPQQASALPQHHTGPLQHTAMPQTAPPQHHTGLQNSAPSQTGSQQASAPPHHTGLSLQQHTGDTALPRTGPLQHTAHTGLPPPEQKGPLTAQSQQAATLHATLQPGIAPHHSDPAAKQHQALSQQASAPQVGVPRPVATPQTATLPQHHNAQLHMAPPQQHMALQAPLPQPSSVRPAGSLQTGPSQASMAPSPSVPGSMAPSPSVPGTMAPCLSAPPSLPGSISVPGSMALAQALPGSMASLASLPGSMAPTHSALPGSMAPAPVPASMAPSPSLPGSIALAPSLPGSIAPAPSLPGSMALSASLPGSIAPAPFLAGSIAPAPSLPGSMAPSPSLPGSIAPAPSLPGSMAPSPSLAASPCLPGGMAPAPSVPGSMPPSPSLPGSVAPSPTSNPTTPGATTTVQTMTAGQLPIGTEKVTSSTHPAAWHFLYRLTREDKSGGRKCSDEIVAQWNDLGQRDKLLHDFVHRCWRPDQSHQDNKVRLDCLVRLRQMTRQWRQCLQGFEWLTEKEMKDEKGWDETKIKGAVEYCVKRRMVKKCLYTTDMKYLVLTKDSVENGESKTRTLEQEIQECGLWDTEWSLGDLIGLDDMNEGKVGPGGGLTENTGRKKLVEFPPIEGGESLQEFLGQYKKCCLNKKATLKQTKERLTRDLAKGYEADLEELEKVQSAIAGLYANMTALEVRNEGREKSAYVHIIEEIRVKALDFNNKLSVVKTHFAKPTAKAKSKSRAAPPQEDAD